jgi:hypothetical protein
VLGWPKRCKWAHALLWEHSHKELKLTQLLGRHGVCLTLLAVRLASPMIAGAAAIEKPEAETSRMPSCICARRTTAQRECSARALTISAQPDCSTQNAQPAPLRSRCSCMQRGRSTCA